MPDVSIMVSAQDNFSSALKTMARNTTPFRKDIEQLQGELDKFNKNKYELKVESLKAKRELDEAKKAFKKTGDAASELELKTRTANYDNLKSNLDAVSRKAKQTEKDMLSLTSTVSKSENRASSKSLSGSGLKDLGSSLGHAGAYKMIGDTVSQMASVAVGSAFGKDGGTMFGSMLSSGASGAAIGSMIAPGIGTAVGGIAGTALGAAQGVTQIFGEKDDAFKGYVKGQYDNAMTERRESLLTGSEIAAKREMDEESFSTMFKNKTIAKSFLSDVKTMSNSTPFLYDDLTSMGKSLSAYGFAENKLVPMMKNIGNAGAALGMDTNRINMTAKAIGKMNTVGKVYNDQLQQLAESGIDAYAYLADAKGVSKNDISKMASLGEIDGKWAVEVLMEAFEDNFSGAMERQSKTMTGLSSTLEGWENEMAASMGEGYNNERKKGITNQIDYLSGENGKKMMEANKAIGAWEASLENKKEEYIREAQKAVIESDEYIKAKTDGEQAKMGELLMRAKIQGINKYNENEGKTMQLASELSLIKGIREDASLKEEYWNAGKVMGDEFSKGLASTFYERQMALKPELKKYYETGEMPNKSFKSLSKEQQTSDYYNYGITPNGYAFGMEFVPHDNFPAVLHYGERVLTANQARNADRQQGAVTINASFTVTNKSDVEDVAEEIARKLRIAMEARAK